MRKERGEGWREKESEKKTNKCGRGVGLRLHLPETMKMSKTHKCSHCHFLYLIYAELRRPNNANERWCLLMLTTGDNSTPTPGGWTDLCHFIGFCDNNHDTVNSDSGQNYTTCLLCGYVYWGNVTTSSTGRLLRLYYA